MMVGSVTWGLRFAVHGLRFTTNLAPQPC